MPSFSLSPLTTEGRFVEEKLHVYLPLKTPSLSSTIRVYDNTQFFVYLCQLSIAHGTDLKVALALIIPGLYASSLKYD
jgi:hypothetical protein